MEPTIINPKQGITDEAKVDIHGLVNKRLTYADQTNADVAGAENPLLVG